MEGDQGTEGQKQVRFCGGVFPCAGRKKQKSPKKRKDFAGSGIEPEAPRLYI